MTATDAALIDGTRIEALIEREDRTFAERTPGSAAMYEDARKVVAGGVQSSFQSRDPYPIYLERGEGGHVWDVDGNEYVDVHSGYGALLVGHANPAILLGRISDRRNALPLIQAGLVLCFALMVGLAVVESVALTIGLCVLALASWPLLALPAIANVNNDPPSTSSPGS